MTNNELMELAIKARENSYCKYSGFAVGAALLAKSGKVYLGCNVENASFSPTCCAERTAFFSAIAAGEREFEAIAICGGKQGEKRTTCTPCGVCRQVMSEFCGKNFPVLLEGESSDIIEITLGELLPFAFDM